MKKKKLIYNCVPQKTKGKVQSTTHFEFLLRERIEEVGTTFARLHDKHLKEVKV